MVWHEHSRARRFLAERGFVQAWRRIDAALDVAGFDPGPYRALEERLATAGIVVRTYADLVDDPDRLRKLYELDASLWREVPYGRAPVPRTMAQFAADEVAHPADLADACFVALDAGRFVGYSNLTVVDEGLTVDMTGVLPAYRRRGIGALLKLCGIRYARSACLSEASGPWRPAGGVASQDRRLRHPGPIASAIIRALSTSPR